MEDLEFEREPRRYPLLRDVERDDRDMEREDAERALRLDAFDLERERDDTERDLSLESLDRERDEDSSLFFTVSRSFPFRVLDRDRDSELSLDESESESESEEELEELTCKRVRTAKKVIP
ncbi:hypothetical protein M408DRAFT_26826 [Serendipita vermifera MAFF 305830]|uniref:Uncharacterized protein n=1 Tax=Serendipita vermifera MAFF 305830 TaxID=933852 RepID=A0A0C2WE44_SERVB|nr:hypothetical protein M408DRAFT_26826 [Serendipita vermifera MAFF 305830]